MGSIRFRVLFSFIVAECAVIKYAVILNETAGAGERSAIRMLNVGCSRECACYGCQSAWNVIEWIHVLTNIVIIICSL